MAEEEQIAEGDGDEKGPVVRGREGRSPKPFFF